MVSSVSASLSTSGVMWPVASGARNTTSKPSVRELLCGVDGRGVLDLGHDDAALFVAVEMRRTVQADIGALRAAGGEIDFLGQAAERRGNRSAAVLEQM